MENFSHYMESLSRTLQSASRHAIKLHLSFVANHLYPVVCSRQEWRDSIFHDVFFPFLLYSKPRQKAAAAIWEILEGAGNAVERDASIESHELLGGCVETVRWHEASSQEDGGRNAELWEKINLAVASKIAGTFCNPLVNCCVLIVLV